jgi:DNA-binding Lrp family transcriptional regulator
VAAFEERMAAMEEVAELRRMSGIPDYFIRVQIADLASYERWLTTQLLGDPGFRPATCAMRRCSRSRIQTDAA